MSSLVFLLLFSPSGLAKQCYCLRRPASLHALYELQ